MKRYEAEFRYPSREIAMNRNLKNYSFYGFGYQRNRKHFVERRLSTYQESKAFAESLAYEWGVPIICGESYRPKNCYETAGPDDAKTQKGLALA